MKGPSMMIMNSYMMTDRELLEAAAKAADVPLDLTIRPDGKPFGCSERGLAIDVVPGWWNPLTDDGDALRLAVDLKMKITVGNAIVMVEAIGIPDVGVPFTGDAREATRRAIVRAAAAIGEQMP